MRRGSVDCVAFDLLSDAHPLVAEGGGDVAFHGSGWTVAGTAVGAYGLVTSGALAGEMRQISKETPFSAEKPDYART